jgi:hypothetical protein
MGGYATESTREIRELGLCVYRTVLFSRVGFLRGPLVKMSIWIFAEAVGS